MYIYGDKQFSFLCESCHKINLTIIQKKSVISDRSSLLCFTVNILCDIFTSVLWLSLLYYYYDYYSLY